MHAITRCGFIIYEDRIDDLPPFAIVETPHASAYANDPADVEIYRTQLAAFRQSAVYGDEALEICAPHRSSVDPARRLSKICINTYFRHPRVTTAPGATPTRGRLGRSRGYSPGRTRPFS